MAIRAWRLFLVFGILFLMSEAALLTGPTALLVWFSLFAVVIGVLNATLRSPQRAESGFLVDELRLALLSVVVLRAAACAVWIVVVFMFVLTSFEKRYDTNAGWRSTYMPVTPSASPLTPAATAASFEQPLRTLYLALEGRGIDLFLNPPSHTKWEESLDGTPFVVHNRTFDKLADLAQRYSEPVDDQFFYVNSYANGSKALASDPPHRPTFVGSPHDSPVDHVLVVSDDATATDLIALQNSGLNWRAYHKEQTSRPQGAPEISEYLFRRNWRPGDINRFGDSKIAQYLAELTADVKPLDFAWLEMVPTYQECGSGEERTFITLVSRVMRLHLLVLENVSGRALNIGPITFVENSALALRPLNTEIAQLDQLGSRRSNVFTPGILKAGERIVIPMRMELAAIPPRLSLRETQNYKLIAGSLGLASSVLAHSLNQSSLPNPTPLSRVYVYGPSFTPRAVRVGQKEYPIRKSPEEMRLILSGNETGSCPRFYGYDTIVRQWISGGVVLKNFNAPSLAADETRSVPAFDGRIMFVETEPETSYLDFVQVVATDDRGRIVILVPDDPDLKAVDGKFVRLHNGEQRIVTFARPTAGILRNIRIRVHGFYVPNAVDTGRRTSHAD